MATERDEAASDERVSGSSLSSGQRVPFPTTLWTWLRSWWSERGPAGLTPTIRVQIAAEWPEDQGGGFKLYDVWSPVVPAQGEWIRVDGMDACVTDRSWSVAEGKLSVLLRAQVNP